ncbi:MAG TPA: ATP-binding protein, partial [Brevefilum fermentans]|nr:ATP-binding protein [Brevefilum fermentans]HQA27783.1 ATP-binding protein [Brevefilum fermentans]
PLDQRKLFRKFSRITTDAEADDEGSGLGLAIVKSIAERHGGEVRVESQLGKGSIFYFEIPRKYSA